VAFTLNPFGSTEVLVIATGRHGPYLFVEVQGRQLEKRFIAPASDACARVLTPQAAVRYDKRGNFGRFLGDGESCDLVGTLSLAAWRGQRHRGRRNSGVPRSTAHFRVAHRDAEYILLRGRFPLAARARVPAPFDVVAVLPENEACSEVASRRQARLEFRAAGARPFRLIAAGKSCFVAGFAMAVETSVGETARGQRSALGPRRERRAQAFHLAQLALDQRDVAAPHPPVTIAPKRSKRVARVLAREDPAVDLLEVGEVGVALREARILEHLE
jgi:hypothetical protein